MQTKDQATDHRDYGKSFHVCSDQTVISPSWTPAAVPSSQGVRKFGARGFEPPTSCSQSTRSSQAELRPGVSRRLYQLLAQVQRAELRRAELTAGDGESATVHRPAVAPMGLIGYGFGFRGFPSVTARLCAVGPFEANDIRAAKLGSPSRLELSDSLGYWLPTTTGERRVAGGGRLQGECIMPAWMSATDFWRRTMRSCSGSARRTRTSPSAASVGRNRRSAGENRAGCS